MGVDVKRKTEGDGKLLKLRFYLKIRYELLSLTFAHFQEKLIHRRDKQ